MGYRNYDQIRGDIRDQRDFDGNSMRGRRVNSGLYVSLGQGGERPPANAVYIVWSYDTPIGWVTPDGQGYVVPQKFSVTTSRHQSLALGLLTRQQLDAVWAKREQEYRERRDTQAKRKEEAAVKRREREQRTAERLIKKTVKDRAARGLVVA